jgi:hypothetical protein
MLTSIALCLFHLLCVQVTGTSKYSLDVATTVFRMSSCSIAHSLSMLTSIALCLFHLPCVQVTGTSKYSLDVATTVFRMYQLQPSMARKELIAKALLKALAQMPKQDYRILIHMLPEKLVVSADVAHRCCCCCC